MVHCCMYAPAKFASFYKTNRKLRREGESVPDVTLIKKFPDYEAGQSGNLCVRAPAEMKVEHLLLPTHFLYIFIMR